MLIRVLRAKIHRASVTAVEQDYDGSCAIDRRLLMASNILPFEQIQIYNVTNGERFTTYAIEAGIDSGIISVNGAAAHKASIKDKLIICAYSDIELDAAAQHKPNLIYVDSENRISRSLTQVAASL